MSRPRRQYRIQFQRSRPLNQLLTPDQITARLFIGVFPCGISYADRGQTEFGDYKRVAFLPYDTLVFDVIDVRSPLLMAALEDAVRVQARRGETFQVSTCGQTVLLGYRERLIEARAEFGALPVNMLVAAMGMKNDSHS